MSLISKSCSRMDEFAAVENYVRFCKYPSGVEKGDKANLRKKCNNNFKLSVDLSITRRKKVAMMHGLCV